MNEKTNRIELSERLMKIAAHIRCEDTVADIGTDHGYLPIWLAQNHAAAGLIISDINEGPLEKATAHLEKYGIKEKPSIRRGSGLEVLQPGEADVIVIAGMGGILISFILDKSPEVVRSARRLILQPRNHSFDLRASLRWLKGFRISDEEIAVEGRKLCEIITVTREDCLTDEEKRRIRSAEELEEKLGLEKRLLNEVPAMLLVPKEGAARIPKVNQAFLLQKCISEQIVIDNINKNGRSRHADRRLARARGRLEAFEKMLDTAEAEGKLW